MLSIFRFRKLTFFFGVLAVFSVFLLNHPVVPPPVRAQSSSSADWYMAGANPQRTSWVSEEVRGNLNVDWYQPIEPYIPYKVQPVFSNGSAYISTSKGLYAFDLTRNVSAGGTRVEWVYPTELPLGNSPTIVTVGGKQVAYTPGYDHKIHAVDITTHTDLAGYIPYEAGAGFETNPLVITDSYTNNTPTVFTGNRDGYFYAFNAINGSLIWRYQTQGPILFSAAYKNGTVYFASNDDYAYALSVANGNLVWKSQKFPGGGFYSYWPVIYTDKITGKDYVSFTGSANYRFGGATGSLQGIEGQYFFPNCFVGSGCAWGNLIGPTSIAPANDPFWSPGSILIDISKIATYYEDFASRRTVFVLDRQTGQEHTFDANGNGRPDYAPFTWSGTTRSGNKYPPVIGQDGIYYQDTVYASAPYILRGHTVGWEFGSHFVSQVYNGSLGEAVDEPRAYAGGGKLMYWALCCDRLAGAFDVTIPYGQPNRSWTYWSYYTLMQTAAPDYDPMYNDGTAEYTDMNGWQVYSGKNRSKNGVYGKHGSTQSPPIPYKGKVYTLKGNTLIAWSPSPATAAKLSLAPIVSTQSANPLTTSDVQQKLNSEVQKMINAGHLRPGYSPSSIGDQYGDAAYSYPQELGQIVDYFENPSDTVATLLQALPYLSPSLQDATKTYLQTNYCPLSCPYDITKYVDVGWKTGAPREAFDIPTDLFNAKLNRDKQTIPASQVYWKTFTPFSFYAAWKYTLAFGNAKAIFDQMSTKLDDPQLLDSNYPQKLRDNPYILNLYIAGYEGYLELQKLAGYTETASVRARYNDLLSIRTNDFSKDTPFTSSGDYHHSLSVARNFMFLTPELGDYLSKNIRPGVQTAVDEYSYVAPYWFVSKFDDTYGEGTLDNLYNYPAVFQARAYILKQPYNELVKWLDVPAFQTGDLFYIQNLTAALWAAQQQGVTPPPVATPILGIGDVNGDGKVDTADVSALFANWFNTLTTTPDQFGDGLVNSLDFAVVASHFPTPSP